MKITQEVNIDVVNYGAPPVIYATQGDLLSRQVKINFKDSGKPLEVPDNSSGIVKYKRTDGTGGNYDTNSNGEKAVSFSNSAAVVQIAPSVLSHPGIVDFVLAIVHGDSVLHTFALQISVKENPGFSGSDDDDFYLSGALPDSGWEPYKYLGTDGNGKVIAKDAPSGGGGAGHMVVTYDDEVEPWMANHSASEIIEHLDRGGSAILKWPGTSHGHGYAQLHSVVFGNVVFYEVNVDVSGQTEVLLYTVGNTKEVIVEIITIGAGSSDSASPTQIDFSNFDNGSFTETVNGEVITHTVTFDAQNRPITIDGCAIVWGAT